jgi:hypothetical protein
LDERESGGRVVEETKKTKGRRLGIGNKLLYRVSIDQTFEWLMCEVEINGQGSFKHTPLFSQCCRSKQTK